MFEATRMAALVSRIATPDPDRWLSAPETLHAATEGGARVLGLAGRIGRLAAGFKADIVFLDLRHVRYAPLNDPTTQIVFAESGSAVDGVMIGGRMVVENGRVTTVDVSRLKARAEAAVERLRAATAEARGLADRLEAVVTSHCGGLEARSYHVNRRLAEP
jgi:guanine deaminase